MAVLEHVTADELALLAGRVKNFAADLEAAIREAGLFAIVPAASAHCVACTSVSDEVAAPRTSKKREALNENGLYATFFHAMLARGVALAPGAYEILFVSLAHDDEALERTVSIAADAASDVRG